MKKYIYTFLLMGLSIAGRAQSGLKKGAEAPDFTAVDNSGKTLDLQKLLKTHKAVVVFFYRGQWCPYCNKHIKQLQDSKPMHHFRLFTTRGIRS